MLNCARIHNVRPKHIHHQSQFYAYYFVANLTPVKFSRKSEKDDDQKQENATAPEPPTTSAATEHEPINSTEESVRDVVLNIVLAAEADTAAEPKPEEEPQLQIVLPAEDSIIAPSNSLESLNSNGPV